MKNYTKYLKGSLHTENNFFKRLLHKIIFRPYKPYPRNYGRVIEIARESNP